METGVIKWYNDAKRYGFIVADNDNALVIVEQDSIQHEPQVLFEMQTVEFNREQDAEYGAIAKDVKVIGKDGVSGLSTEVYNAIPNLYTDKEFVKDFVKILQYLHTFLA